MFWCVGFVLRCLEFFFGLGVEYDFVLVGYGGVIVMFVERVGVMCGVC